MEVTIIGAGNMGKGIGTRVVAGGHDLTILDRDGGNAQSLAGELGGGAKGAEYSRDAVTGDVVVLAVYYPDARALVEDLGDHLDGKVVVECTNPVNESFDDLVDLPAGSASQELAQLAPGGAKLVKAFNTTFSGTLVEGEVAGQPLDVFIAGDDDDAKRTVSQLVEDGGLRPIDAGELRRASELEAAMLLNMRMQSTLGTNYASALKILS